MVMVMMAQIVVHIMYDIIVNDLEFDLRFAHHCRM